MDGMIDRGRKPTIDEISDFIGNPLFLALYESVCAQYGALCAVEYSGDNVLPGWNVRLSKAGRTLLRLYPKKGFFSVLVVVGRREKERVEALLPQMSGDMREIYHNTKEGMGQRWLLIDLKEPDALYRDVQSLVRIRRQPEQKRKSPAAN